MNFSAHFAALEALAEKKLADSVAGMTTTKEISALLGIATDEAVGAYEAYNKQEPRRFEFEREYSRDYVALDWHVIIKKKG